MGRGLVRWVNEQLHMVDPPSEQLPAAGLQVADANLTIDKTSPSLDEVREAVEKLKGGKATGISKSLWSCSKLGVRP